MTETDVLVIGAGAAGLAAARAASSEVARVMLVDPEENGGILRRCIHDGFGLDRFGDDLTGPEYADRFSAEIAARPRIRRVYGTVTSLTRDRVAEVVSEAGAELVKAKAVVLASGSRERAFGALDIAGRRYAGIMTAGEAQKLVNIYGMGVGRRVVILGSGDVGLIMARRLTLEGAKVECVLEAAPYPGGLARNIVRCLSDFNIPLELSSTVVEVRGSSRLEEVVIARTDEHRRPVPGTERTVQCDALILSVGLLPVLSLVPYLETDKRTKRVVTDSRCGTSVQGIYVCGNASHIHDIADSASAEGELAGLHAARFALGKERRAVTVPVTAGSGIASVSPMKLVAGEHARLYVRTSVPMAAGAITVGTRTVKRGTLAPNETVVLTLGAEETRAPVLLAVKESS